mgnify:FL=1
MTRDDPEALARALLQDAPAPFDLRNEHHQRWLVERIEDSITLAAESAVTVLQEFVAGVKEAAGYEGPGDADAVIAAVARLRAKVSPPSGASGASEG